MVFCKRHDKRITSELLMYKTFIVIVGDCGQQVQLCKSRKNQYYCFWKKCAVMAFMGPSFAYLLLYMSNMYGNSIITKASRHVLNNEVYFTMYKKVFPIKI